MDHSFYMKTKLRKAVFRSLHGSNNLPPFYLSFSLQTFGHAKSASRCLKLCQPISDQPGRISDTSRRPPSYDELLPNCSLPEILYSNTLTPSYLSDYFAINCNYRIIYKAYAGGYVYRDASQLIPLIARLSNYVICIYFLSNV